MKRFFSLSFLLFMAAVLFVGVCVAPQRAMAVSDSDILGTWSGSGGSGTGSGQGQTMPITMSYVTVMIGNWEGDSSTNVRLRSLVVNSNTGEALHEFDWNEVFDSITVTHSGNTWTFTNSAIGEKLTMTLSSETEATATLEGNRNGISGKISSIPMTKDGSGSGDTPITPTPIAAPDDGDSDSDTGNGDGGNDSGSESDNSNDNSGDNSSNNTGSGGSSKSSSSGCNAGVGALGLLLGLALTLKRK